MRQRNLNLKVSILEKGISQREFAKKAEMAETILSMIISGSYIPSKKQRSKIAKALGKSESDIFVNHCERQ
jgi:transcriptional regulator with XRE-family HTH domain